MISSRKCFSGSFSRSNQTLLIILAFDRFLLFLTNDNYFHHKVHRHFRHWLFLEVSYQHPFERVIPYEPNLPMSGVQDKKGALHIFVKGQWCIHLHNHLPFLLCHLLALKPALFRQEE